MAQCSKIPGCRKSATASGVDIMQGSNQTKCFDPDGALGRKLIGELMEGKRTGASRGESRSVPPRAVVDDLPLALDNLLIVPLRARPVASFALALPLVADLALVLDLPEALLSVRTDAVRDLYQFQDILLQEKKRALSVIHAYIPYHKPRLSAGSRTYIFQVLHNVEERLRLLVFIPALLDRLAGDQILRDLRPHILRPRRRGRRKRRLAGANSHTPIGDLLDLDISIPALVIDLHTKVIMLSARTRVIAALGADGRGGSRRSRRRRGREHALARALGDKLRLARATVPLPDDLSRAAAGAVHADLFGSGRHVDHGPVLGAAAPRLAHGAAGADAPGDALGFVFVARGRGVGSGARGRAAVVVVDVDFELVAAGGYEDFVLVVVLAGAGRWALTRLGTGAWSRAGS